MMFILLGRVMVGVRLHSWGERNDGGAATLKRFKHFYHFSAREKQITPDTSKLFSCTINYQTHHQIVTVVEKLMCLKGPDKIPWWCDCPSVLMAVVLCVFNFSTMSIFSSTCTDVYLKNSKLDWLHVESGFLKKGSLPSKPRNDPGMRQEFRLIKLIQSEFIKMTTMTRNFYQCGAFRGDSGVIPG